MHDKKLVGHKNYGVSSCRVFGGFVNTFHNKKPYILVSFGQNINFKQRTELTDRRRAENKSHENQAFHLDAG